MSGCSEIHFFFYNWASRNLLFFVEWSDSIVTKGRVDKKKQMSPNMCHVNNLPHLSPIFPNHKSNPTDSHPRSQILPVCHRRTLRLTQWIGLGANLVKMSPSKQVAKIRMSCQPSMFVYVYAWYAVHLNVFRTSIIMHPARPKAGHRRRRWTGEVGRGA